jgi:hypothetical protein
MNRQPRLQSNHPAATTQFDASEPPDANGAGWQTDIQICNAIDCLVTRTENKAIATRLTASPSLA